MKALQTLCAMLVLALLPGGRASDARAEGTGLYAVEIIVFRVVSPAADEDLAAVPPGRGFGNENTHGGVPQVMRILPPSDYRLAGVEASIRNSGTWRPVAHAAWVQSAAAWGTHAGIALGDVGVSAPGLSGMVYVERGTYLHLGMDLTLNAGGVAYTIREMRSVKFNERQYFDHPGFGVIAVVSPAGAAAPADTQGSSH